MATTHPRRTRRARHAARGSAVAIRAAGSGGTQNAAMNDARGWKRVTAQRARPRICEDMRRRRRRGRARSAFLVASIFRCCLSGYGNGPPAGHVSIISATLCVLRGGSAAVTSSGSRLLRFAPRCGAPSPAARLAAGLSRGVASLRARFTRTGAEASSAGACVQPAGASDSRTGAACGASCGALDVVAGKARMTASRRAAEPNAAGRPHSGRAMLGRSCKLRGKNTSCETQTGDKSEPVAQFGHVHMCCVKVTRARRGCAPSKRASSAAARRACLAPRRGA